MKVKTQLTKDEIVLQTHSRGTSFVNIQNANLPTTTKHKPPKQLYGNIRSAIDSIRVPTKNELHRPKRSVYSNSEEMGECDAWENPDERKYRRNANSRKIKDLVKSINDSESTMYQHISYLRRAKDKLQYTNTSEFFDNYDADKGIFSYNH
eukprot:TRINITY_DN13677_c0_g1_i1.p1 TRINITY_DN13677_c0_g1~~TRINITY_DN13677_c0_g1_i1.p1  ORF type:complete len:151 (-),score=21.48 TRINITY_DN13677_c0_g1_i1:99-551(-)